MINALALQGLSRIQSLYRWRSHRIHKFKPKIEMSIEIGPYVLKTVSSLDEMKAALGLRYDVFHGELLASKRPGGIDVDDYDFLCDHVILFHKKTLQLIATFRLNCSLFTNEFSSAREFDLSRLLRTPGTKLEIGRLCIHKDFRDGFTTSLLWRGIAEYMTATGSQILFGCASIKTRNPREAALLYRHFAEDGRMSPDFFAPPTKEYTMPELGLWLRGFGGPLTEAEKAEVKDLIPSLCRASLKVGAMIGGEPAWDSNFKCIDFLTLVHREDLNRSLWKRYKQDSGASFAS